MALNDEEINEGNTPENRLEDVAQNEHEYLPQRLRDELGA